MGQRLYCDGGVVGQNPSDQGGTWAWLLVDDAGNEVRHGSGWVTPAKIGLPHVTNNVTELLAAVNGLEAVPAGWEGTVCTDSQITLYRLGRSRKFAGVPAALRERTLAARESRRFNVVLLGGHPTRAELFAGKVRRNGLPCSKWNVECDEECRRLARLFAAGRLPA